MEGNLRFKTDWASLIALPFLLCFALHLRQLPSTSPPEGVYIQRGDLTEGFLRYEFWGAYIWRGLFSEFYGIPLTY